jgi:hypothetical protein
MVELHSGHDCTAFGLPVPQDSGTKSTLLPLMWYSVPHSLCNTSFVMNMTGCLVIYPTSSSWPQLFSHSHTHKQTATKLGD